MRTLEHWLAVGISFFTKGWVWIVGAGIIAAVGGFVWKVREHINNDAARETERIELRGTLTEEQRRAREAQTEFDRQRADERRDHDVALAGVREEARRSGYYAAMRVRITNAPQEDDGPVAPVLRDALRGVRDDLRGYTEPERADSIS